MQGPAAQTRDLLIFSGSGNAQPQAWVLTSDALHSAQPQSCSPHAMLLSDELSGLDTTGGQPKMQASCCSCMHVISASL